MHAFSICYTHVLVAAQRNPTGRAGLYNCVTVTECAVVDGNTFLIPLSRNTVRCEHDVHCKHGGKCTYILIILTCANKN